MNAHILDRDPARPWINADADLPPVGRIVEVWTLEDRTALEDEQAYGRWHAAEGVLKLDGRFTVGADRSALVSHWRALATGPE